MARKFASKKQWRWAFATRQAFARRWAHRNQRSRPYRTLPTRSRGGRRRR